MISMEMEQRRVCERHAANYTPAPADRNSGVAIGTETIRPIHGLRHPVTADTTGWYVWGGEYSNAPDFFKPLHTGHLAETLPEILPLLGLPPGYRFLVTDSHQDVWFDATLLNIE
jgi:hypothetical protein